MPIRFRCAYCNQLMGIARRKAGTVVRCPNCAGQVVVPRPEGGKAVEPVAAKPVPAERPPFFEQNDFDEALSYAADSPRGLAAREPDSASHPVPAPPTFQGDVDSFERESSPLEYSAPAAAAAGTSGIFLSRGMATLVSVILVVALALAFVAGLLVGRLILTRTGEERPAALELRTDWATWTGKPDLESAE